MSGNEPSETPEGAPDEEDDSSGERPPDSPTTADDGSSGAPADAPDAATDERRASPDESNPTAETRVPDDVTASDLTIEPRSLHPRVRIVWVLQSLVSAAIFGVIVGAIGTYVLNVGGWVGPAAFLAIGTLAVAHAILRYRTWSYEVREDALYLERGVLTRVRTVVPYVRIQHVDASRGPLERTVGLASSVVYTAGTRGADVTIPGLTPERADDLQERLKQLAILADGDDAV